MNDQKRRSKSNLNARRKILKSVAVGGGALAAGKSLPGEWTKPVLSSVMIPAHAQTSEIVLGVFNATGVGITMRHNSQKSGIQYALLDALISPATAQAVTNPAPKSHVVGGICGTGEGEPAPADISIRVNEDETVDVAISTEELLDGEGPGTPCLGVTTIIDNSQIQDVTVQFDDDEFLALTNMVATPDQITGDWATEFTDGGDEFICNGSFTAPAGGTFPEAGDCGTDLPV